MIDCQSFDTYLKEKGILFSTGVPDSLLKNFCAYQADCGNHIIAANEGGAISLAAGQYLASQNIPLVYLQNSGFGNIINPLTSLIDPEVYAIPMLIVMGWRGEPGVKDEPQHIKQGRVNEAMLDALEVPYSILDTNITTAKKQVDAAVAYMSKNKAPYVLLVRKDTFADYKLKNKLTSDYKLTREKALDVLLGFLGNRDVIVSTTGKTSRELFELRAKNGEPHDRDFLTVGCMGHASQIALGISLSKKDRNVYCIDGDGATIMHMGGMAIIGDQAGTNYKHVMINNGSHESVGGQPTVAFSLDFQKIALACGYHSTFLVESEDSLKLSLPEFIKSDGPVFLEIRTAQGSRNDLGRPTIKPADNKIDFMKNLAN